MCFLAFGTGQAGAHHALCAGALFVFFVILIFAFSDEKH